MIRTILIIFCVMAFAATAFAQERDILDFAAKNPRASQVQNPDGTWRTPKYGDYELAQAAKQLESYSQPFTVPKVISWYSKAKDAKIRASLLRVLAVSRDPRAALVLGNSLKDDLLDVRVAATYGLMDYFMLTAISGGTEGHMIAAQEWWEKNRERLEKEAKRVESSRTSTEVASPSFILPMEVRAKQRLYYRVVR
jgi:hypothetical protein